jgi:hypothetical protein
MSVEAILKDLKAQVAKDQHNFQYRSHVVDFTFNNQLICDELTSAMSDYVDKRRSASAYTAKVSSSELAVFKSTSVDAVNNIYTYKNIQDAHSAKGFLVIPPTPQAEEALNMYTGARVAGELTPKAPKAVKLATIVHKRFSVNTPSYAGGWQGLNRGITSTYSASMGVTSYDKAIGKALNPHNEVVKLLWFQAVKEHKKILIKVLGGTPKLGTRHPMANQETIGRENQNPSGKTRSVRLHGPGGSKDISGNITGDQEDTSEKIVSVIDAMKRLSPGNVAMPNDVKVAANYATAHRDILEELDLEFIVNGESISDIVTLGKVIRIKMSQGGAQHQDYMKHADKTNVEKVLNDIEKKLLSSTKGLTNPEYKTSKSVSQLSQQAVVAQVVKYFTTKSGKPDMRYKVNKQAALKGGQRSQEKDSGRFNLTAAGSRVTRNKKGGKVGRKSKNIKTSKQTGTRDNNPIALKELINNALPEAMLLKMQPPSLRNRTGRFRQSAEVTNVTIGPRGGTDIDYTYMRDPYEVFEPGGKMGSRNRDPRKLIGGTIREIAVQLTGNKFIRTRRQ